MPLVFLYAEITLISFYISHYKKIRAHEKK
jgi:hypothetical protein